MRARQWEGDWRCAAVAALALLALVSSGCRKRSAAFPHGQPVLGKVSATRSPSVAVRGTSIVLDEGAIASKAKEVLSSSELFSKDEATDKKRSRVDVAIALEIVVDDAVEEAEVGIKARLKIDPRPAIAATARYAEDAAALGQAPLGETPSSELVAAFQRLAERITEDLLRSYVARQKLWSADETTIAKALLSDDGEAKLEAVRIVGARKLKAQLPAVIRLLSDSDEATRDAALGAVVAMGERGAIKALADSRQMRDSYEMSKVVDAVASLGGQEASDYLSFVAETHDDSDIRKMAEAALARLKTREVKASPTR